MNILFILIPLSLALMGAAVWALFWAIDNGQFDDLEASGRAVLEEDEVSRKGGPSP